jgi:glucokinase
MPPLPVLIADVGGTHVRFALLTSLSAPVGDWVTLHTADYSSFADAAWVYLRNQDQAPRAAVVAAAGPVQGSRVAMTNIPWIIDANRIGRDLGFESVKLLNDFAALAWALPALSGNDVKQIGSASANFAKPVIALGPGTGFGACVLLVQGSNPRVLTTEAGHAALGIAEALPPEIAAQIDADSGRISIESVLSGPGLARLYAASCRSAGVTFKPMEAPAIVDLGLSGYNPQCADAIDLFWRGLAAVTGDLVLSTGAFGGAFIGGGMALRLLPALDAKKFRAFFSAKEPMRRVLEAVSTVVITHLDPVMVGVAQFIRCSAAPAT